MNLCVHPTNYFTNLQHDIKMSKTFKIRATSVTGEIPSQLQDRMAINASHTGYLLYIGSNELCKDPIYLSSLIGPDSEAYMPEFTWVG